MESEGARIVVVLVLHFLLAVDQRVLLGALARRQRFQRHFELPCSSRKKKSKLTRMQEKAARTNEFRFATVVVHAANQDRSIVLAKAQIIDLHDEHGLRKQRRKHKFECTFVTMISHSGSVLCMCTSVLCASSHFCRSTIGEANENQVESSLECQRGRVPWRDGGIPRSNRAS